MIELDVHAAVAGSADVDPAAMLGRKGLFGKDRATLLALCAVHEALDLPPKTPRSPAEPDPGVAVVVSSNLGNVGVVSEIARGLRADGVRSVSPMLAPGASSNVIAGAIAIWFRFGGPNLTVCSGAGAGFDAIWLAGALLQRGRARRAVVVGVEPDDEDAQALHSLRHAGPAEKLTGGAACLILSAGAGTSAAAATVTLRDYGSPPASPAVDAAADVHPDTPADSARYGAAGVFAVCAAVADVRAGGPPRDLSCGDAADGYRTLRVGGS
ncbi:beta-ketoacyl synthase N-terminal-like domain-containing protein [Planotetraspora sp. GP83]|uniref:beta-ketoacyl synthase N-terminal-like domain-containing protein n=1 Tax=Planotetraspora sp. GP83 TaxID=3156264 RepID=UPI003517DFA2